MMEKNWIECEKLIRDIERMKRNCYEVYFMKENTDDASSLAQLSQRLLGQQQAFDSVINILRGNPGSDDA